jgi:hypothetical protein
MFRWIWSSLGSSKTAAITSMNTVPNYTLVYAPMCCCTYVIHNCNCVSVSYSVVLTYRAAYVSCAPVMSWLFLIQDRWGMCAAI